jgi:hypothetical protein
MSVGASFGEIDLGFLNEDHASAVLKTNGL